MANRNTQGFPSPEEDPRFHDTYQFYADTGMQPTA